MAEHAVVFNTTDTPITISPAGAQVGGGEWATVNLEDPAVRPSVDAGQLVVVEEPDPGNELDPRAAAAFDDLRATRDAGRITTRRSPKQSTEEA